MRIPGEPRLALNSLRGSRWLWTVIHEFMLSCAKDTLWVLFSPCVWSSFSLFPAIMYISSSPHNMLISLGLKMFFFLPASYFVNLVWLLHWKAWKWGNNANWSSLLGCFFLFLWNKHHVQKQLEEGRFISAYKFHTAYHWGAPDTKGRHLEVEAKAQSLEEYCVMTFCPSGFLGLISHITEDHQCGDGIMNCGLGPSILITNQENTYRLI